MGFVDDVADCCGCDFVLVKPVLTKDATGVGDARDESLATDVVFVVAMVGPLSLLRALFFFSFLFFFFFSFVLSVLVVVVVADKAGEDDSSVFPWRWFTWGE